MFINKSSSVKALSRLNKILLLGLMVNIFVQSSIVFAIPLDDLRDLNRGAAYRSSGGDDCLQLGGSDSGGGSNETATNNIKEFIDKYGQAAFNIGKKYGIPYEAIIAQAALESGYGKSELTQRGFNFFGIKAGSSWTGPVITMRTREQRPDGSEYFVMADFRAYGNAEEGFDGYGQFIHNNSRYANALNYPNDPVQYIVEIRAAGYATATDYVSILTKLIHQVENYIKEKGLFPPSSEVTPDVQPPNTTGDPSSSNTSSVGCKDKEETNSLGADGTGGDGAPGTNKALGRKMVEEKGWSQTEFECLDKIWTQESGWDHTANNPSSSAYGIPQALVDLHRDDIQKNYPDYYSKEKQGTPGKPSTYDYEGGNPATQIRWGLNYIEGRFGTPCEALKYKQSHGTY